MNNYFRKFLVLVLIGGYGLALGGCNTMRGVGKDTEEAGEKIQESADRNSNSKQPERN